MSIDTKHPTYIKRHDDWVMVRDSYEGERVVKEAGTKYLPPTSGMEADGMTDTKAAGFKAYNAYRTRAHFPDVVKDAVEAMLGVMHHKPPVIELPAVMEPLREKATIRNESLEMLLRRINEEQLITGRCGILADLPEKVATGVPPIPYLALYQAENIINWDQGRRDGLVLQNLNLVVLDESEYERQADFSWEMETKHRVLVLGDVTDNEAQGEGTYQVGVFRGQNANFNEASLTTPSIRGNSLNEIPFTFINSKDIVPEVDHPPLLGLSQLCFAIYRGEADYRQSLFKQGQDTLVVIGSASEDEDLRVGADGRIDIPQGGDAKYIGVSSQGLAEQRQALEKDYNRAAQKGGQLMDSVSRERESGDALKIRVAARTASLNQIAIVGAFGLQEALRKVARWMGANDQEVIVTPNLDFVDDNFAPDDLVKMISAKNLGAPIAMQTIHRWLQDKDITDLEYEEEMDLIDEEEPSAGSMNPDDLVADEDENEEDDDDNGSESE